MVIYWCRNKLLKLHVHLEKASKNERGRLFNDAPMLFFLFFVHKKIKTEGVGTLEFLKPVVKLTKNMLLKLRKLKLRDK